MSTKAMKAVTKFMDTREQLKDFMEENQDVMDAFIAISEEYNADLNDAKGYIREIDTDGRLSFGLFVRSKPPTKIVYDPTKVDIEILTIPGVIKSLDTKIVEGLVQQGKISAEKVNAARMSTKGTPRISGPKPIEVTM